MNQTLRPQDIKIVKGKAAGKTSREIAKEVYPDTKNGDVIVRQRLQKLTIQEAVKAELLKQGVTLTKVLKPVVEALEASDEVYSKTGEYIGSRVNHSVRLQAHDRAAKLMGITTVNDSPGTPLSSEDLQALASESDEIKLTEMVFRKS